MIEPDRDTIRELRDELREVRVKLRRYDGFLSRLLCPTCLGDRVVAASREACSTETLPCPKCRQEEYK